jgi:hypothetical protein
LALLLAQINKQKTNKKQTKNKQKTNKKQTKNKQNKQTSVINAVNIVIDSVHVKTP